MIIYFQGPKNQLSRTAFDRRVTSAIPWRYEPGLLPPASDAFGEGPISVTVNREPAPPPQEALFQVLGAIDPTPAGIESFARQFAGLRTGIHAFGKNKAGRLVVIVPSDSATSGDNGSDWKEQILSLRRCVRMWELLRSGNSEQLARHIQWRTDSGGLAVCFDSRPDLDPGCPAPPPDERVVEEIASVRKNREVLGELVPGDVQAPASIWLCSTIEEHLGDLTRPRILGWHGSETMSLCSVPQDLLAGVWLQFAQAVAENKDYGRCKECGAWFEVSPQGARKSRMYCSDICKIAAYHNRIDRAVGLHEDGWSDRKIAKELGTTEEQVKLWISSARKRQSGGKKKKRR
jgi:hypothetical protein